MLGTTLYQPRSSPARSQDTGQDLQDGSVASGSVHDNSSVAGSTSSIKGAVPMEVHRVTLFKVSTNTITMHCRRSGVIFVDDYDLLFEGQCV